MNFQNEPAQIVAYLTSAVTAILALLVAYGFDIDQDQQSAILGVVAVIAPVVAGLLIRGQVYSPNTVKEIVKDVSGDPRADIPNVAK